LRIQHVLRVAPRLAGVAFGLAVFAIAAGPALSGTRKENSAPSRPAAAAHGAGGGGALHMPGSMGGGAHVPGSMGGGAHVPGSMAGGPHIPGSMGGGAHLPQSTSAHVPGSGAHSPAQARYAGVAHDGVAHDGVAHDGGAGERPRMPGQSGRDTRHAGGEAARHPVSEPARALTRNAMMTRPGDRQADRSGGRPDAHHDPRVGGHGPSNTRGLEAARDAHHEPRAFLRADSHRDVARDHAFAEQHRHDFHDRDVRSFSARELAAWRGGAWRNEWHYGRRGWWWEVDGVWYGYPEPIWPYPFEVAPLVVYDTPFIDGPDLTAEEIGSDPAIPPLPPAPVGWFRCASPGGAFPTVGTCGESWELVPGTTAPG
jgi:hypothetical protein